MFTEKGLSPERHDSGERENKSLREKFLNKWTILFAFLATVGGGYASFEKERVQSENQAQKLVLKAEDLPKQPKETVEALKALTYLVGVVGRRSLEKGGLTAESEKIIEKLGVPFFEEDVWLDAHDEGKTHEKLYLILETVNKKLKESGDFEEAAIGTFSSTPNICVISFEELKEFNEIDIWVEEDGSYTIWPISGLDTPKNVNNLDDVANIVKNKKELSKKLIAWYEGKVSDDEIKMALTELDGDLQK